MFSRLFIVIASAFIGSIASAAPLPRIAFLSIGFTEATLADFKGTPQAIARRTDKRGYLAVTADFNGDGQDDEARMLLNKKRSVAYIVAVISSATKVDTYVLTQMPLQEANNVGITRAKPLRDVASGGSAGITIFALDTGQGEASYFDGEDFNAKSEAP